MKWEVGIGMGTGKPSLAPPRLVDILSVRARVQLIQYNSALPHITFLSSPILMLELIPPLPSRLCSTNSLQ